MILFEPSDADVSGLCIVRIFTISESILAIIWYISNDIISIGFTLSWKSFTKYWLSHLSSRPTIVVPTVEIASTWSVLNCFKYW